MLYASKNGAKPKGDVLCVHGIFDTGHVFTRMAKALSKAGWNVHTPSMQPPTGKLALNELAQQIANYMKVENIGSDPERPWILIGFSMGGLVSRSLLQNLGVENMPHALITLGSPHHGSILTFLFWGKGTRDMRPGSSFLKQLKKSESKLPESLPCYSLWTPLDLMIIPSWSSLWKRAHCECYWAWLHPHLLINRAVIRRVLEISDAAGNQDAESITLQRHRLR